MNDSRTVRTRARKTNLLCNRISLNKSRQKIDLVSWIFKRLKLRSNINVLELCCGTGSQTIPLLKYSGRNGGVVATDISRKAIKFLTAKAMKNTKLKTIVADIDSIEKILKSRGVNGRFFDLIFCAYGLYYSKNCRKVLEFLKSSLNKSGKIVVVGPYGENNKQLFDILRKSGASIQKYVEYVSRDFMIDTVVLWAKKNFKKIKIHTLVNPVYWDSPAQVINYWRNSTFYVPKKLQIIQKEVKRFFASKEFFLNEKHIMMVEMSDEK